MKVAFRVDVSPEIGTGHLSRMSVLAEAFTELSCECTFYKGEDEPVDYSGFDVIVVDTYQVDDAYITSLNAPSRIVVCYDDNALYTYDCDAVLNANLHAGELRFKFGAKTPRMLLGGKYALLRKEFREAEPIAIKEKANRVFVCFGGSDLRNMTPRVIEALMRNKTAFLTVVLGALTSCDGEVKSLASENVAVYKTPESISRLMTECDVAVTAAGSMIYELAALGLPTILVAQADNQLLISEYMSRQGLMKYIGDWQNVELNTIKGEVEALLRDVDRRSLESSKLKNTVDRNGAMNAAHEIMEYYQQRRHHRIGCVLHKDSRD